MQLNPGVVDILLMANSSQNQHADSVSPEDYYILPNKRNGRLRACLSCKLLKCETEWRNGCENCPDMLQLYGDIDYWTTPSFTGMCALMEDKDSWVSKHQRIVRLAPGLYAIVVQGTLTKESEDIDLE